MVAGHGTAVFGYTPRQVVSFLILANKRERHEAATKLSLQALASQGDGKAIEKQLKELTKP